jgi:hypothetical protein
MKGYPHLLHVLVLSQVAMSLLAGVGESVFLGTPLYLLVPVLRGALLLGAALAAARPGPPRRWPLVVLIVPAQLGVIGYVFSNLLGVLPWVSDTVNLVGLLTNVALPLAVTWLAANLLATWRRPPAPVVLLPAPPMVLVPAGWYPPPATPRALPALTAQWTSPWPGPAPAVPVPVARLLPADASRSGAGPGLPPTLAQPWAAPTAVDPWTAPEPVTRMLPRDGAS